MLSSGLGRRLVEKGQELESTVRGLGGGVSLLALRTFPSVFALEEKYTDLKIFFIFLQFSGC